EPRVAARVERHRRRSWPRSYLPTAGRRSRECCRATRHRSFATPAAPGNGARTRRALVPVLRARKLWWCGLSEGRGERLARGIAVESTRARTTVSNARCRRG